MQIRRLEVHGALVARTENRHIVSAKDIQNVERIYGEQGRSVVTGTTKQG